METTNKITKLINCTIVFSLPIRDGNPVPPSKSTWTPDLVFSLPIRDGNPKKILLMLFAIFLFLVFL